jgi:hypothetical protein
MPDLSRPFLPECMPSVKFWPCDHGILALVLHACYSSPRPDWTVQPVLALTHLHSFQASPANVCVTACHVCTGPAFLAIPENLPRLPRVSLPDGCAGLEPPASLNIA